MRRASVACVVAVDGCEVDSIGELGVALCGRLCLVVSLMRGCEGVGGLAVLRGEWPALPPPCIRREAGADTCPTRRRRAQTQLESG